MPPPPAGTADPPARKGAGASAGTGGGTAPALLWQALARRLAALAPPGPTLALLDGAGWAAHALPGLLRSDRRPGPGPDLGVLVACDPESLPFPDGLFACLCGLDVLGRTPRPARVLIEAERVLHPGGRLVLIEPWTGPLGALIHRLGDRRPVDPGLDPWFDACPPAAWARGNAGVPRACLDGPPASGLERHAPRLRRLVLEPFAGLAEAAARRRPDAPALAHRALALEDRLPHALRRLTGSRVAVVLERF